MKKALSQKQLIDQLLLIASKLPNKKLICLSGFPASGKTTISDLIVDNKSRRIVSIPTDNYIFSRITRDGKKLSACNPMAYKMEDFFHSIGLSLHGKVIESSNYSHISGKHSKLLTKTKTKDSKFIIVDGTVGVSLSKVCPNNAQVFWFHPKSVVDWIKFATIRDIDDRSYKAFPSLKKNVYKMIDCIKLHKKYLSGIDFDISCSYKHTNHGYDIKYTFAT